ncbi:MAG: glycosyltransferase, partial [Verrucomicrobiota bacterium]|nr:glycosyltransferase [Verrucomicrobiota bacterium]
LNRGLQERYKLMIIGTGSQHDALVKMADEKNISDDVLFYGACYDDKILAPLIMMADICLSPGEVGLTALHSLIYGTPVITHDNFSEQMPEFEAICPGVSGEFYIYGNIDDLCTKIKAIIGLVDAGLINPTTCREAILKSYNTEYQAGVFVQMLSSL